HTPPGGAPAAQPTKTATPRAAGPSAASQAKPANNDTTAPVASQPAGVGSRPAAASLAPSDIGAVPVATANTGVPSSDPAPASAQTQAPVPRFEVSVQPVAGLRHAVPAGIDLAEL